MLTPRMFTVAALAAVLIALAPAAQAQHRAGNYSGGFHGGGF